MSGQILFILRLKTWSSRSTSRKPGQDSLLHRSHDNPVSSFLFGLIEILVHLIQYGYRRNSAGVGIGINTGKAFLGNIGSPERMEFTVIGDIVNVASRLSDIAKPGQILISDFAREQIGISSLQLKKLDPVKLKGKKQPLKAFSVLE